MSAVISVAVMAHPKRTRMVQKLVAKLDARPRVIWDTQNDVWHTGRQALLACHPQATHHLVIQDDAVAPRRLLAGCERIVAATPGDVPISLYMGRWRHRPLPYAMRVVRDEAERQGASFAVFGGPWWGVGIILPTTDIEAVVAYGDENPRDHSNYDIRIAQFYDGKGVDCWYTTPSVLDHQRGPSLIGRRGSRRHSVYPLNGPLDDLDWSGPVIHPGEWSGFPVTP